MIATHYQTGEAENSGGIFISCTELLLRTMQKEVTIPMGTSCYLDNNEKDKSTELIKY